MPYGRSDAIVGYTFAADNYCPGCVVTQLPTGPGQAYDGWALAAGAAPMTVEDNLTEIAEAFGIDRFDERTYDSGEFPKVIFADSVEGDRCGGCGEFLIKGDEDRGLDDEDDAAVDPAQGNLFHG